MTGPIPSIHHK